MGRNDHMQPLGLHRGCFFVLVLLSALGGGCRKQSADQSLDKHAQIFDSDKLVALLTAAPQTLIDLDAVQPEEWLTDKELGHPQDSLVLTHPFMFVIAKDSLYFANFRDAIYVAGFDGILRRQIGRPGKGPGEFDFLSDFAYSGSRFFVGEASRIQVLSDNFEYLATMPPGNFLLPGTSLDAATTTLYTKCGRGQEYLVCPRSTEPPFEERAPFFPALGFTNPSLDGIEFGATPDGQYVFVSYQGLPYVFVFNQRHEHIHTIRLLGDPVDAHAGNYTTNRPGVPGTGLRVFLSNVHVLNNEYVAIPIRDIWHFIKIQANGGFEHVGATRLIESNNDDKAVLGLSQGLVHDGYLYVYAFRVPHLLRYQFPY